ncbi:MAG: SUMF1/EgtB/PvdO family nonheme iron enzyme [Chthoniobacterales bacterium]
MKTKKAAMAVAAFGLALGSMALDTAKADTFGTGTNAFTMDFVEVGNPGNANDSTGYGAVANTFRIGTFEVSRDMITKANAAGSLLIDMTNMSSWGGNGPNRAANGVSWNEAARFVNWLNTSKGYSAAYKFALQPGDAGYSQDANIQLWDSGDSGYNAANRYRNSNAFYYLPSEDEWYKAAYYSGTGSTYYDYATMSNTTPTAVAGGTGANEVVYNQALATGPGDITNAGGLSYYGTMAQNGNVFEQLENSSTGANDSGANNRLVRGGFWNNNSTSYLNAGGGNTRLNFAPDNEAYYFGFRVASVIPEPSTAAMMLMAGGAFLLKRRKANRL